MCGINGIFAYHNEAADIDAGELLQSRDYMASRGPDGSGEWISHDHKVGLAHRRLAIIDLSETGIQPMAIAGGRYRITFNGEIYNYQSLRNELKSKGCRFNSQSDTEVLLYLYKLYKQEMVLKLRGMYAFAIWDEKEQCVFLARDPYGIKPLFYNDDGRTFRFASQVRALQAGRAISSAISPAGITGFFLWGSIPEPLTIFEDIQCLPAGHTLMVSKTGYKPSPRQFWNLGKIISNSIDQAADVLPGQDVEFARTAFVDSVKAHMVSDVPVGAFLSAGFDSSAVVSLAQEVTDYTLETITLAFKEFLNSPIEELPTAIEIAKHIGVSHHCVTITTQEMEDQLDPFLRAMDQPTIDGINTWFVSKAAAELGLKVALSGLGGDELLGGYSTFKSLPEMVNKWSIFSMYPILGQLCRIVYQYSISPWSSSSPKNAALALMGGSISEAYQVERGIFMPWELKYVLSREVIDAGLGFFRKLYNEEEKGEGLNEFGQVAYMESTRYMRNQLLRDTDWVGMAHSLEIRVPLVDSVLTEKIIGLAANGRLGEGKSILPRCLPKSLPKSALCRPKTGFTVPIWKWLRKSRELSEWRRIKFLNRSNVHNNNRWAYSIASRFPGVQDLLKK